MKTNFKLILFVMSAVACMSAYPAVTGYVRFDKNQNGWPDDDDPKLAGMLISDGFGFAETDENGKYTLNLNPKAKTIYVQRTDEYTADVTKFWHRITPGRQTYDFLLEKARPVDGDTLTMVVIGDSETQESLTPGNLGYMKQMRTYVANHPEVNLFINAGDISAGSPLGMETQRDFINQFTMGIPVAYACGNHDIDFRSRCYYGDNCPFGAVFGPWWQSFELGGYLFVMVPIYNSWGTPISYDMLDCGDWLKALCERYPDKKKIMFCHDLPDLVGYKMATHSGDIILDDENFVCTIYGHKHMNIVKKYPSGRKAFCVATPNKGGAGCFTQCFRVVRINRTTDKADSELIFNNAVNHLALITPTANSFLQDADGKVIITADASDGGDEITAVSASLNGSEAVALEKTSEAAWQGATFWAVPLDGSVKLTATTKSGRTFSQDFPVNNASEPKINWIKQLPADVAMADLQLVNGLLIVAAADDVNAENGGIYALDPENGEIVWFYRSGFGIRNNFATDGARIFAIDTRANIHAIDAATGERVWLNPSDPTIVSPSASGLVCHNGIVAGGYGRHLRGIDANTGKTLWRNTFWQVEERTPAEDKLAVAGDSVIVLARLNGVYRHDLKTGKVIWFSKQWLPNATTLVDGENVWLMGSNNNVVKYNLADGKVLGEIKPFPCKSTTATPVRLDNGMLLVASGDKGLGAIDLNTNKEAWRFQGRNCLFPTGDYIVGNPYAITATPMVDGDELWVASNDGYLYEVDPANGTALREVRIGMPILNKPCTDGSRIFVSDCCGRIVSVSK
ncbi:MAG: PQQ-binding-like beta-propeller repeat protein [Lentisphaeria bacterium]|nr:PQQ-binding-like beta-propeller repeat protein [Lentisphaeria bacterium]